MLYYRVISKFFHDEKIESNFKTLEGETLPEDVISYGDDFDCYEEFFNDMSYDQAEKTHLANLGISRESLATLGN